MDEVDATVKLGSIKMKNFKELAKQLGRACGVSHCRALEALAVVCGWATYEQLLRDPDADALGAHTEIGVDETYAVLRRRIMKNFGVGSEAQLDEVPKLRYLCDHLFFRKRSLATDLPEHHMCREGAPGSTVDPMFGAADWRDAEFRTWISRKLAEEAQGR